MREHATLLVNALTLLFDRFLLAECGTAFVSDEELVSSVITEVTRLLNVRAPLTTLEAATQSRRTVIDYGLVDFLHLSPLRRQDSEKLAAYVYDTVDAYEPRLVLEKVVVEAPRPTRDALYAILTGYVRRHDRPYIPVNFSVRVASALSRMS